MNKRLIILCLLGDPTIPATSEFGSGGFNADMTELADILAGQTDYPVDFITNSMGDEPQLAKKWRESRNVTIHHIVFTENARASQEAIPESIHLIIDQVKLIISRLESEPFLIHSHYWLSGYVALQLKKQLHIPFIHSAVSLSLEKINAGSKPKCTAQYEWEQKFLPEADLVLAITDANKETLCALYGLPDSSVVVMGRGVAKELLRPSHNASGGVGTKMLQKIAPDFPPCSTWWNSGAFTYIGRMVEDKGVREIILAWYKLWTIFQDNMPPLWLAGGEPDEIQNIRRTAGQVIPELTSLEQSLHICWWGYLSPGALSTVLMRSLTLVHHSRYETGGRVIIEAMSTKTPVIATPFGFAKDYIIDWENGFLVPFGDINKLAERMSHFVLQPLLSNIMGNGAFDTYINLKNDLGFEQRQLRIYRSYYKGNRPMADLFEKPTQQQKPACNSGVLTTYPYISAKVLEETLYTLTQKAGFTAEKWNEIHSDSSFLWKCSDQYIAKQFYTSMNKARLWEMDTPEAVPAKLKYRRAVISSSSSQILPIVVACSEQNLLITEYTTIAADDHINHRLSRAAKALVQYAATVRWAFDEYWNGSVLFPPDCNNTLCGFWHEIRDALRINANLRGNFPYAQIANIAERMAIPTPDVKTVFGVNYGKTIWGHCVPDNGQYRLLPSGDTFWGEVGWDAGLLLAEWLQEEPRNPNEVLNAMDETAWYFGFDRKQAARWTALHLTIALMNKTNGSIFPTQECEGLSRIINEIADIAFRS